MGHLVAPRLSTTAPWAERHVETIALQSGTAARRQLTIDIVLPHDGSGSVEWDDGHRLFYVPVSTIAKEPATSHLDLTDEDGRNLPVLNRAQNAAVSSIALRGAATEILGGESSRELGKALRELCRGVGDEAYVAMTTALIRILLVEFPGCHRLPKWPVLEALIRELAATSVIWLGIRGVPGERRVLQLGYDIDVKAPPIPRRRPFDDPIDVYIPDLDQTFTYARENPGDGNERGSARRLANRIANAMGLAAFDIDFFSPYVEHSHSYHLQVAAPPGLETRRIRLRAKLLRRDRRIWPRDQVTRDNAHLYFEDAQVDQMGTASVSLRVGRRGFLSQSLLVCSLISGMLWLFSRYDSRAAEEPEASVAILLLVPALLVALVVRPGEHALVTRLIFGVRFMVLLCGILSVITAMALVGILPFGTTRPDLWRYTAEGSTVVTAALGLAWLLALDTVEVARRWARLLWQAYGRYATTAAVLLVAAYSYLLLLAPSGDGQDLEHVAHSGGTFILGVVLAWAALFASETRRPRHSRLVGYALMAAAVVLIAASPLIAGLDLNLTSWTQAEAYVRSVVGASMLAIPAVEIRRRAGYPKNATPEDEDLRHQILDQDADDE